MERIGEDRVPVRLFGLIGYPLSHSFSQRYFQEKFEREGLTECRYELFPLPNLGGLPALLAAHPELEGLNVTIPHKVGVMALLDAVDAEAAAVGAVNVIRVTEGKLTGYNSDVSGFRDSLLDLLGGDRPERALVLGTGGASRAVVHVLAHLGIPYTLVSRNAGQGVADYRSVDAGVLAAHRLVINTTPLGMHPSTDTCPDLAYDAFTPAHYAFDLVYNPSLTRFLAQAATGGARIRNGLDMLYGQAARAWQLFQR
ncbi:MAG: hypothetical protein RLY31_1923 [Bacteroidota bacterium]